ncbi:chitinase, partial [Streptomyces sp. SID11233]|nr:chitinase [Streptomyces sp. SID11233]
MLHFPQHRSARASHGRGGALGTALAAVAALALGATALTAGIAPASAAEPEAAVPAHALTGYWQNFDNG